MLDALEVIFTHIGETVGGKNAKAICLFIACELKINNCITADQLVYLLDAEVFKP